MKDVLFYDVEEKEGKRSQNLGELENLIWLASAYRAVDDPLGALVLDSEWLVGDAGERHPIR